ncbi:unnamed protein product, partial [Citrullus colocynthis]
MTMFCSSFGQSLLVSIERASGQVATKFATQIWSRGHQSSVETQASRSAVGLERCCQ